MPLFQAFAHIDRAAVTARTARPDSCPVTLIRLPMPSSATLRPAAVPGWETTSIDGRSGRPDARGGQRVPPLDSTTRGPFGSAAAHTVGRLALQAAAEEEAGASMSVRRRAARAGGWPPVLPLSRTSAGGRRDLRLWLWGRRRRLRHASSAAALPVGVAFRPLASGTVSGNQRWAFARLRNIPPLRSQRSPAAFANSGPCLRQRGPRRSRSHPGRRRTARD